jgi:hypothetical protein
MRFLSFGKSASCSRIRFFTEMQLSDVFAIILEGFNTNIRFYCLDFVMVHDHFFEIELLCNFAPVSTSTGTCFSISSTRNEESNLHIDIHKQHRFHEQLLPKLKVDCSQKKKGLIQNHDCLY